eukprot:TRINITY_DN2054_c0_g1_i1.p1 TRINITY_DN2054_c0_g1~~TRINITY_DN2054_c0_g1_i1.p1  ORF type:complete len:135 (-),score=27.34 TRINITY_DN2054_c0_g1_i1:175-579(-)
MRKEKKRNQISGIHQYIHLLEKFEEYPFLLDSEDRAVSFPPVTNSGITRISEDTEAIMVEVTSSTKLADVKTVADTLLREMLESGLCKKSADDPSCVLHVHQGRVVDHEGSLRVTYPSKTDLTFQNAKFAVERT